MWTVSFCRVNRMLLPGTIFRYPRFGVASGRGWAALPESVKAANVFVFALSIRAL